MCVPAFHNAQVLLPLLTTKGVSAIQLLEYWSNITIFSLFYHVFQFHRKIIEHRTVQSEFSLGGLSINKRKMQEMINEKCRCIFNTVAKWKYCRRRITPTTQRRTEASRNNKFVGLLLKTRRFLVFLVRSVSSFSIIRGIIHTVTSATTSVEIEWRFTDSSRKRRAFDILWWISFFRKHKRTQSLKWSIFCVLPGDDWFEMDSA